MPVKAIRPFEIPPEIVSAVNNGDAAIMVAMSQLQAFLRRLVVFDGYSDAYWALIVTSMGIVVVCELIGAGVLMYKGIKGNFRFFDMVKIKKVSIPTPTMALTRTLAVSMAGVSWCAFCVHSIMLDREMRKDSLNDAMNWIAMIWVPIFVCGYLYVSLYTMYTPGICG